MAAGEKGISSNVLGSIELVASWFRTIFFSYSLDTILVTRKASR